MNQPTDQAPGTAEASVTVAVNGQTGGDPTRVARMLTIAVSDDASAWLRNLDVEAPA